MDSYTESFDKAAKMLCSDLSEVLIKIPDNKKKIIQEIRLRSDKPVALSSGREALFVCESGEIIYSPAPRAFVCSQHNLFESFKGICGYSVYSKQNEINGGYITSRCGSRIGICGTASLKNGEINSVTDITSMNIRVSRQIFGISRKLLSETFPLDGGILIVGAPSTGKTTLLRDIAYNVSLGKDCRIMRTCVIDERGELSGGNSGHIDLGLSDVMCSYPKDKGIIQAIRSLSPQLIICDEVGTDEDASAIAKGANAGAFIIASIHAGIEDELMRRSQTKKLLNTGAFRTIVYLSSSDKPGQICKIVRNN